MATSLTDYGRRPKADVTADKIREQLQQYSKDFKVSWTALGQSLYAVWKDKLFYSWGYEKFEYYVERELGLKKPTALKLLKNYFFLEQEEPAYLTENFADNREPKKVPGYEAIDVLRMAKRKKELSQEDYQDLRKAVFDTGKDAGLVRKDLTAMIRERKEVDPEEEKRKRNETAIRKLMNAIRSFEKDMEVLKLIPANLIEEAKGLMDKLEKEIG